MHATTSHRRLVTVVGSALVVGMLFSFGCEPRKKAKTGGVGTAATPVAVAASPTGTTTATTTAATTAAPTGTATAPAPAGTWPTGVPSVDPAVLADIMAKAGAALGLPAAGGAVGTPGDPLDTAIKANAAKNAPGFTAASAVGRSKLKTGEHAGMNVDLDQGKCYVVVAAGGAGVTQVGLAMLFPAAPPNAVMASDTNHGASPYLGGDGKPLCPPAKATVRVDVVPLAGTGDVGVQLYVK